MTKQVTLFCIPHAGGNRQVFSRFVPYLSNWNVVSLELPGKGSRFDEPQMDNLTDIINDLYDQISDELPEYYCFWGHSMGALLAFLLSRRLVNEHKVPPRHLFLSGRTAPTVERKYLRHNLPEREFNQMLIDMGGVPQEIIEDSELLQFFEPIIRKDFKAVETYEFIQEEPLPVPITVMIGDQEETTLEEAEKWKMQTKGVFKTLVFEGGHFFIFNHINEVTKEINKSIDFEKKTN